MFFEHAVGFGSGSILLRGITHVSLLFAIEATAGILNNIKEKVRLMINIQVPVKQILIRNCIRFREVFCATVWAFGVETAVV